MQDTFCVPCTKTDEDCIDTVWKCEKFNIDYHAVSEVSLQAQRRSTHPSLKASENTYPRK